jgi:ABC-type transport system involved in multi-copper enzyme maturation permease subunit
MLFLPLIHRELMVRSRRGANYWGRFAVGLVAMMTCLPPLLMADLSTAGSTLGATVFNMLTWLAFGLCCVACILTSDVIASEKRDGTLGLLLQTRVRAKEIIISKLASSGIASLGSLLALVPFLAVPIIVGGVTFGETFRKVLALITSLFLALCVGIYASSCASSRQKVVRKAVAWLVAIVLFPVLVREFWPFKSVGPWLPGVFSPLVTLMQASDSVYHVPGRAWLPYWLGVLTLPAIAWAFLTKAAPKMETLVREEIPIQRHRRETPVLLRPVSSLRAGWPPLASPVEWLVERQRGMRAIIWAGVLSGVFYYIFFRAFFAWRTTAMPNAMWLVYWIPNLLFGSISGAFFAWAASRFFVETRKNGELELLLTTPVGPECIVRDQWRVLLAALAAPIFVSVLAMLLPFGYSMLTIFQRLGGNNVFLPYSISMLLSAANVVVGTLALCRVGLWFGLRAPGQGTAILWTLAVAKGVPYIVSFAWSLLSACLGLHSPMNSPSYFLSFVPSFITIAFLLWLMRLARTRVTSDLIKGDAHRLSFSPIERAWEELVAVANRFRKIDRSPVGQ